MYDSRAARRSPVGVGLFGSTISEHNNDQLAIAHMYANTLQVRGHQKTRRIFAFLRWSQLYIKDFRVK